MVVPSHAFRETLRAGKTWLAPHRHIAWATKGMEHTSSKFMHTLVAEELGEHITTAVLSGPTFAAEVARGLPTAITVASGDREYAESIGRRLHDETFRAYTSHDMIGVEVGGSIKNVLAIAAGVADGLGFGANTRAALITRGLSELTRLGIALGGQAETFMGLAGMGDLVLTCTDNQSRNRRFGLALARGLSAEQARKEIGQVVEGEYSAKEAWQLAQDCQVDMPICEQVYRILFENLDPQTAVHNLLGRRQKAEDDDNHAY
jgi:glycerol-3-phosphate dehydrogenase (NAD(P)+)